MSGTAFIERDGLAFLLAAHSVSGVVPRGACVHGMRLHARVLFIVGPACPFLSLSPLPLTLCSSPRRSKMEQVAQLMGHGVTVAELVRTVEDLARLH